jgi:hypothetical protein
MTTAEANSRNEKTNFLKRNIFISCKNSIGEKNKTFTADDNGKQNSPSFDSFYEFTMWTLRIENYVFRQEYLKSNKF